jgi:hypothetical protein
MQRSATRTSQLRVSWQIRGKSYPSRDHCRNGRCRKSFAVFEAYADRVVVLKDFTDLQHLPPRKEGFYDAIVDLERTRLFPEYCRQMLHVDDPHLEATIRVNQKRVQAFMEKIEKLTSEEYRLSITELEQFVPAEHKPHWRAGKPVTAQELDVAKGMVAGITTKRYRALFPNRALPNMEDGMYWVPFRYTVALQALTLKWLRDGGHESVKPANPQVDLLTEPQKGVTLALAAALRKGDEFGGKSWETHRAKLLSFENPPRFQRVLGNSIDRTIVPLKQCGVAWAPPGCSHVAIE